MVGVAGRSKGCATCKKRKVRCDLAKPACQNCVKAKRECGGYDRPLVFISVSGGDDQPRASSSSRVSPASRQLISHSSTPLHLPEGARDERRSPSSSSSSSQSSSSSTELVLAPEFGTRQANDAFLIASFVNVWTPTTTDSFGQKSWVLCCADMANGTECGLTVSLRALALARCAKIWQDDALLQSGRHMYGKALRMLQRELFDERTKFSELVMAACRVLSTYEFLESSSDSVSGWITHVQGMENVVYLRGPARFKASLKTGALLGWRTNVMIRSLIMRKASFLSSSRWSAETSPNLRIEEQMNDLGLRLGALTEKADRALAASRDCTQDEKVFNLQACINVVKSLQILDNAFDIWYTSLCNGGSDPFWAVPDFSEACRLEAGLLHFTDLDIGLLITTFWALKITLSDAIQQLFNLLDRARRNGFDDQSLESMGFVDALVQYHTADYRKQLAVDIVRGVPFCLGQFNGNEEISTGLQISQRILYCLGLAVAALWSFGPGVEYARSCKIFGKIMPNISFARELDKRFDAYSSSKTAGQHLQAASNVDEPFASLNYGVPLIDDSVLMAMAPARRANDWQVPSRTILQNDPGISNKEVAPIEPGSQTAVAV